MGVCFLDVCKGFYFARTLETARGYTTRIKEKAGKLPTENWADVSDLL